MKINITQDMTNMFNNPFFRLFCLAFILCLSKSNYLLAIILSVIFVFFINNGLKSNNMI